MKNPPTYDDANLILKLYDLRREAKLREARKWFGMAPQFQTHEEFLAMCPPGSDANTYARMVASYWDMAASFVVTGVLNRELFYRANNQELLFVWEKMRKIVPTMREKNKNPLQFSQMEDVANGYIEFLQEKAPGFYESFSDYVSKIGR